MPLRAAFGTAGHELQTYLPGTDPALLPAPAGPDAAPAPDALASPPYTPGGDGTDTLFDGRVTATTTGAGTAAAARTAFDVVGPWNSVKNAAAAADGAARLAFLGFVHVDAAVGLASEQGSALELVGAKRGNLVTGAGADLVDVRAVSNDAYWAWPNHFRIASGAGDDTVLLSPLDVDAAVAAGDPTFASAVGGAGDETEEPYEPPDWIDDWDDEWAAAAAVAGDPASASAAGPSLIHGYDGYGASASVDLGDGADVLAVEGLIWTWARGGAGDDWIAGGRNNDNLAGGPGADTLLGGGGDASERLDGGAGDDLLLAGEANDLLDGGAGDDTLFGGQRSDTLAGGAGADTLFGGVAGGSPDGGDLLEGGAGDDRLDGGRGGDTAAFAGRAADFEVVRAGDGRATVRDLNPADGDEGTDALADVERLRFADRTVDLREATAPRFVFNASWGPWVSDGTAEGTWRVADVALNEDNDRAPGAPDFLVLGDGRALFGARPLFGAEGDGGSGLWVTDGTAEGTRLVKDTSSPGTAAGTGSPVEYTSGYPAASPPHGLVALGDGRALFGVQYEGDVQLGLWVTDGTAEGTRLVRAFEPVAGNTPHLSFVALGDGRALFAADDRVHGPELWVSDGTAAGTRLVKDIQPGGWWSGSDPHGPYPGDRVFVALGDGRALFAADDGVHGRELWVSDGTADGTRLVAGIDTDPGDWVGPRDFLALGDGRALYVDDDGVHGRELWVSDGTADGTRLVADIDPGVGWARAPGDFVALGDGQALFVADDRVHGPELWVSDGTAAGTRLVADITPGVDPDSSGPGGIVALGDGRALFVADDGAHGRELWVSDGTAAGTRLVADITPGALGSGAGTITGLGDGRALFSAYGWAENGSDAPGWWTWISDGTAAGTAPLVDTNLGYGDAGVSLDPLG